MHVTSRQQIEIKKNKSAIGIKNVTANENFFTGHFPNQMIKKIESQYKYIFQGERDYQPFMSINKIKSELLKTLKKKALIRHIGEGIEMIFETNK